MSIKSKEEIIDYISGLNVKELVDLIDDLKKLFKIEDLSFAAPSGGGAPAGQAVDEEKQEQQEKTEYQVHLKSISGSAIPAIKVLRRFRSDLGLKEAKSTVDSAPCLVKTTDKEDAEAFKKALEEAGATVELK